MTSIFDSKEFNQNLFFPRSDGDKGSKSGDETTLIEKDGLMYLPDSDKAYTGEVFTNYENGQIAFKGEYRNGLKDGRFEDYYENGQTKKLINYDNNVIKGNIFDFTLDGESITYEINGLSDYSIKIDHH